MGKLDIIKTKISLAPFSSFRNSSHLVSPCFASSLYRKDFPSLSWEALFLTSNSSEFKYRVPGDNLCRDHERLGTGGRVLGKPMCEGTAVFEIAVTGKGRGRFHYYETITLGRHEIESAYLPSFKNGGATSVPDEHVSSVQIR
jgi:hypothetical protein